MNEESLFQEALSRSPAERAAFLDQECVGQPELRAAVEALLAAHERSGNVLDQPPIALGETVGSELAPDAASPLAVTTDHRPQAAPGVIIAGRYALVEKIGEGGMGEVWVAKQTEPVKRKVALKLIKAGMDSKTVLQRFEQERQALALMDHPNIAKVLDGGLTPDRRPFFVMELVNGRPLTKFCDEAKLGVRERLELFAPICQAVQHAHQKGIVHRDLKPSNILVTIIDGRGVPKVIDFGVAKATSGRLTDESLSTQFGAVMGTLEYMSPEQAGFAGEDIDTRADIYSLGVILYELLTGLRPLDAKRLRQAAFTEMVRIIKEEEPSKPSTRLSTDESLPSLAALRQTEPKRLMALLRGELDWVVMKCLEKQRDRRYETANALARDLQRYLANEPVEARPPTAGYRLSKFLRRNKGPVLAAGLLLLALLGGITGTTLGMLHAERLRGDAEEARGHEAEQRTKAEKARDRTRQALDAMTSSLTGDSLIAQKELGAEQMKFLTEVLTYYQEFAGEKADDEQSRARTAQAAFRVGQIQGRLGRNTEAAAATRAAIAGYTKLVRDFPVESEYRRRLAQSHNLLGPLLEKLGKRSEAEEHSRRAVVLREKLLADFPKVQAFQQDLANSHIDLGLLLYDQGNLQEAEQHQRKALVLFEKLAARLPASPVVRFGLGNCHRNLADLLDDLHKPSEADKHYRQSLLIHEKLAADFPAVRHYRLVRASGHAAHGRFLTSLRRFPEAEQQLRKAITIQAALAAEFPAAPHYQEQLAISQNSLGGLLDDQGKPLEAEEHYKKAISIQEHLAADFPVNHDYQVRLGGTYNNLGQLSRERGQLDESLPWFEKAIRVLNAVYQREPRYVMAKQYLFTSLGNRAEVYLKLRKFTESLQDWDKAIDLGTPAQRPMYCLRRAITQLEAGKVAEALAEVNDLSKNSSLDAGQCYDCACIFARASGMTASGKTANKKQEYADRAMWLLRKAVAAGFNHAAHMRNDTDLDSIRARDDFKKLIAELKKRSASKSEKQP
jgi:serine/threonine protein kinase